MTDQGAPYPIKTVVDHLSSVGVIDRNGRPSFERIAILRFGELVELGEFIAKPQELSVFPSHSPFVQCASISLGGGSDSCAALPCRLDRARALARYAATVTDCVYVHNPFSEFLPTDGQHFVENSDETRFKFFHDLAVFLELAPLVDTGFVLPFPAEEHYCHYCLAEVAFGETARHRLEVAMAKYKRRFRDETRIVISKAEHGYTLRLRAPETVLTHGESLYEVCRFPRSLSKNAEIKRDLKAGREAIIPTSIAQRMRLCEDYASSILRTLRYGFTTTAFGASYVTDATSEIQIIMDLSTDVDALNRNRLVARHLTSVIPFLDDIKPAALAQLRKAEPESFVAFRKALSDALSSVQKMPASEFTAADARTMYGDIIEPELMKLQKKVNETRRKAIRRAVQSGVAWGAALSFGLYSGVIPVELAGAVKALGLTKVFADAISQTAAVKNAADSIREESFYFLWRARRLRSRH